jgi:Fic family protein
MKKIKWNWQSQLWPHFNFEPAKLEQLERDYAHQSGLSKGSIKHITEDDQTILIVELMSDEALKTSEIEGEHLDRESLQSSIRKNLGLNTPVRKVSPQEAGISEMMVDLYQHFDASLTHKQLFDWHSMICSGRRDLDVIGGYRIHDDPMQIVSNRLDDDKVFFEAPPSATMITEMNQFMSWFEETSPGGRTKLLPLARAGIAHFYFLGIHPFEDGNGRIARAISEKALSQDAGQAALISLSTIIESKKKDYYSALEAHNFTCELTDWLLYFGQTIIDAQSRSLALVEFLINKAKFYDRYQLLMNERQQKVIARLFAAGPTGFGGGLSAKNYVTISKTSSSTATRDLQDLVSKNILKMTGERKSSRYWLNL